MSSFSGFESIFRRDAPLSEHTWYRLGGAARWLLTPRDEPELAAVLQHCREHAIAWKVLGRGANVLVRDEGFDGAVIRLSAERFCEVRFDHTRVHAGAGADFLKLVHESIDRGLVGLEVLAGIPGTVGGVVRMNAGGRYGEIGDHVHSLRLIEADGNIVDRPREQLGFAYRRSNLTGCVVLAALFTLEHGDADRARARYREIWNEKYSTQPPVAVRSAGCIFKNPPEQSAGMLLDRAGLKGLQHGQAQISPQHANFIIAHPGATARDVLDLIALAKDRVYGSVGVELELEVEIW